MFDAKLLSKIFIALSIVFLVLTSCQRGSTSKKSTSPSGEVELTEEDSILKDMGVVEGEKLPDLAEIKKRGKLVAITDYSSTSYFIYRGTPMGYEYELLNKFAQHLGVKLEIIIARNLDEIFDMLKRGEGDIIAYSLTVTKQRREKVAFTTHHNMVRQVLVQRKPDNWRQMKLHQIDRQLIQSPIDLAGKTVHVRLNTSYHDRLVNLQNEIGDSINIVTVAGDVETEQLITEVAEGKIDYTVADENIAMLNATYYRNLDISVPISFPQRIAWAVRHESVDLLEEVNTWIAQAKRKPDYNVIYNKYYRNRRAFMERAGSDFFSKSGQNLSNYDDYFRSYAKEIDWDWRLFAAMAYKESQFDPGAVSWAGAVGLMQIMPATGQRFGATNLHNVENNIQTSARFIRTLIDYWERHLDDEEEVIKFVLASYNVGLGHVKDGVRLAEKYGRNPNKWDDNVAYFVLNKSQEKYYKDPVVKHGYCRGSEPFNYVKDILYYYNHYKQFIEIDEEIDEGILEDQIEQFAKETS